MSHIRYSVFKINFLHYYSTSYSYELLIIETHYELLIIETLLVIILMNLMIELLKKTPLF